MPLWLVFHSSGSFDTEQEKQAFAKDITSHYTRFMPAFYVVMNFIKVDAGSMYVGGEAKNKGSTPFIRLVAEHIHINVPNQDEVYSTMMADLEALMKPHIADKGYSWEIHIAETERRMWRINGMFPPAWRSDDEQVWCHENRAVPDDEMAAGREKLAKSGQVYGVRRS